MSRLLGRGRRLLCLLLVLGVVGCPNEVSADTPGSVAEHEVRGLLLRAGVPVAPYDGYVEAYRLLDGGGPELVSRVTPDGPDGRYRMSLPDGTYLVRGRGGYDYVDEWYDDQLDVKDATRVVVSGDDVALRAIDLSRPAAAVGTVVGNTGSPLRGIRVGAYVPGRPYQERAWAVTDQLGRFAVPTGPGEWTFQFRDPTAAHVTEWHGDVRDHADAEVVSIVREQVDLGQVTLLRAGAVSGSVRFPDGAEPSGIEVSLLDLTGEVMDQAYTGRVSHTFAFWRVPPGEYVVHFGNAEENSKPYVHTYYGGSRTIGGAQRITVSADATTSGVDQLLSLRPPLDESTTEISGTVAAPDGLPAAGVVVEAATVSTDPMAVQRTARTRTDDLGRYAFTTLDRAADVTDEYVLTFRSDDPDGYSFVTTYSGGTESRGSAVPVVVPVSGSAVEDVVIRRHGGIDAVIALPYGGVPDDVTVTVLDLDGHEVGSRRWWVDAGTSPRHFEISGIVPGQYHLRVTGPRSLTTWWPGVPTAELASAITVESGARTSAAPVELATDPAAGRIEGRVLLDTGAPVTQGRVAAVDALKGVWRHAPLKDDGSYVFTGLDPARPYHLRFEASGPTDDGVVRDFLPVWWPAAETLDESEPVLAGAAGVSRNDVDVVLSSRPRAHAPTTVTGEVRSGGVLSADSGSWSPRSTTLTYRWLDGAGTVLGTERDYLLRPTDGGRSVRVEVTGTTSGRSTVAESPPVTVPRTTTRTLGAARVTYRTGRPGTRRPVRLVVDATVHASGARPDGLLTVAERRRTVGSGRLQGGRLLVSLRHPDPGRHTYLVSYLGSSWAMPSSTKVTVTVRTEVRR